MAHKKAGGSTSNIHDSAGKRLGVKLHDGQFARAGAIIIRQRGTKFRAGENVGQGKDYTLFAQKEGYVKFEQRKIKRFNGKIKPAKIVNVIPAKTAPQEK